MSAGIPIRISASRKVGFSYFDRNKLATGSSSSMERELLTAKSFHEKAGLGQGTVFLFSFPESVSHAATWESTSVPTFSVRVWPQDLVAAEANKSKSSGGLYSSSIGKDEQTHHHLHWDGRLHRRSHLHRTIWEVSDGIYPLYIDPTTCIDCGACVPVCPVTAIFAQDDLPEQWSRFIEINKNYVDNGKCQADNIRKRHKLPVPCAAHPRLPPGAEPGVDRYSRE
jgi:NAD-dependent dihydropyrimidine dehydrogenase PreA subunit